MQLFVGNRPVIKRIHFTTGLLAGTSTRAPAVPDSRMMFYTEDVKN